MKRILTILFLAVSITAKAQQTKGDKPVKNEPGTTTTPSNPNANGQITLISPVNEKKLEPNEIAQPLLFRWAPVVPRPQSPVMYRLRVWQLMQGQNATKAINSNQPIITKDVSNITQTSIAMPIGPCKPPYLCDFAWNVTAINVNTNSTVGTSETFRFSKKQNDVITKAQNDPQWTQLCTVSCERQGVVFVAAQNVNNSSQYRLSCTFQEKHYYANTGFVITPTMTYYQQILNPHGEYCDNHGFAIANQMGIWEITEANTNAEMSGIISFNQVPMPCDFFTLANIWNSNEENNGVIIENGCGCVIGDGWTSGWQGDSEWIAWMIDNEQNRKPDTSNTFISPTVTQNGKNIKFIIKDKRQTDELKKLGVVIAEKAPAGMVKCDCGKNVWVKNKDACSKVCDYLRSIYIQSKKATAQGDPVHGVDVKLGFETKSQCNLVQGFNIKLAIIARNAKGDPVHGVDVKLGAVTAKNSNGNSIPGVDSKLATITKNVNAQGDTVHGVDVKLGAVARSQGDPVHGVDVKLGFEGKKEVLEQIQSVDLIATVLATEANGDPAHGVDVKLGAVVKNANGDPIHGVDVKLGSRNSAQGDPIHGVDVKLGAALKNASMQEPPHSFPESMRPHAMNLPIEKIIYDAAGNIVQIVLRTKEGAPVPKIVVSGSNSLSGGYEEQRPDPKVVVSGSHSISGEDTPRQKCRTVYCHNPLHPPGCGWQECN